MQESIFLDNEWLGLVVVKKGSTVIFELLDSDASHSKGFYYNYDFTEETLKDLYQELYRIGCASWNNFVPKKWETRTTDYYEYYDKKLGDYGYLSIGIYGKLAATRPSLNNNRLYKFKKRQFQAFVHELGVCLGRLKEELW